MTHLEYFLFLEERDQHCELSGNDYKVFHKLVGIAKSAGWPTTFARSDASLKKVCNIQENTIRESRKHLEAAGLITTTQTGKGRNAATVYQLVNASIFEALPKKNTAKIEALPESNTSKIEAIEAVNTSKIEAIPELNTSKIEVLTIDNKEVVDAASAATPPQDLISEKSEIKEPTDSPKKPAGKRAKGAKASPEDIAALALPHPGQKFAELWAGFVAGPKQQGKSLLAFNLLLGKLAKYAEGFAIVMLEKAIESNWSGVEYESTPDAYTKWQAQQARSHAQPAQEPTIDHAALFGYAQPAAAGLAEARSGPDYQAYLAQQAAKAQVTTS